MTVMMQVPSAAATRSVGEKASPLPPLSTGASVVIVFPDGPWLAVRCSQPSYVISTSTAIMRLLFLEEYSIFQRKRYQKEAVLQL
jgi:hypothetical protein